ncbi:MAG: GTP cyclohydrolase, FolE2/MptA family [Candidatus Euphemobacter frigidus]|nr:GTP cyclohydrolase, FolE2/MptA family [Candidatus Euphemobacter frigidus]
MVTKKSFLVDVGLNSLPFPIRVLSREDPAGQHTVADISIRARILQEFEARWIDKFIGVLHSHRDRIGTDTVGKNVQDYLTQLKATMVRAEFSYPFFVEKLTPVSREKCLVKYQCSYSAQVTATTEKPKILFKIVVPVITTYPGSSPEETGGLFGQLSEIKLEVRLREAIYPEDLVEMVDKHALAPVYSFLTDEDQAWIIKKIHTESKSSVTVTEEIKNELAHTKEIEWYRVECINYAMLHYYSTMIGTEKSMWVPFSGYDEDDI